MKSYLKPLVFLPIVINFIFSGLVFAGSGKGGAITIVNNTNQHIDVVWSGLGCANIYARLGEVCEHKLLKPKAKHTYSYNWGVTKTWVDIALLPDKYGVSSPCISGESKDCLIKGKDIKTSKHYTTHCSLDKKDNNLAFLNCNH